MTLRDNMTLQVTMHSGWGSTMGGLHTLTQHGPHPGDRHGAWHCGTVDSHDRCTTGGDNTVGHQPRLLL